MKGVGGTNLISSVEKIFAKTYTGGLGFDVLVVLMRDDNFF